MNHRDFTIERTILKIGNRLLNQRSDDLKRFDLTPNQSETLLFFDGHDGAMVQDLRTYLCITHQAATQLVGRMKAKGLLRTAVSGTDARAREVHLTARGQEICAALKDLGSSVGGDLLQVLSEGEKDQLAALLKKLDCET